MYLSAAGPLIVYAAFFAFRAGLLCESSVSVRFLNLIIHYVNGTKIGPIQKWSVFQDGTLCEAVRYRVSAVYANEYRHINKVSNILDLTFSVDLHL